MKWSDIVNKYGITKCELVVDSEKAPYFDKSILVLYKIRFIIKEFYKANEDGGITIIMENYKEWRYIRNYYAPFLFPNLKLACKFMSYPENRNLLREYYFGGLLDKKYYE